MKHGRRYVSALLLATVSIIMREELAFAQTMSRDGDSRPIAPFIFLGLLLLGGGFLAYINYKTHKPFSLIRRTSLPADDIIERLVGRYTVNGWMTPNQTDRGATFYRKSEPSILLTVLLFLFGIIPGFVYLMLGGRGLTLAVTTRRQDRGVTEVEVIGNGRSDGSMRIAADVLDSLP